MQIFYGYLFKYFAKKLGRSRCDRLRHGRRETPPQYRKTKGCSYIEFYTFDPELGKMRRKRIRINRIKGIGNREKYARGVMKHTKR